MNPIEAVELRSCWTQAQIEGTFNNQFFVGVFFTHPPSFLSPPPLLNLHCEKTTIPLSISKSPTHFFSLISPPALSSPCEPPPSHSRFSFSHSDSHQRALATISHQWPSAKEGPPTTFLPSPSFALSSALSFSRPYLGSFFKILFQFYWHLVFIVC